MNHHRHRVVGTCEFTPSETAALRAARKWWLSWGARAPGWPTCVRLVYLCRLGLQSLPPPADYFSRQTRPFPDTLADEIERGVRHIESLTGQNSYRHCEPLLVSVRSGAEVSIPGMMDTVLNVGLAPQTVDALAAATENQRFALDSYRRFLEMFSEISAGIDPAFLAAIRDEVLSLARVRGVHALDESWLRGLITAYKTKLAEHDALIPDDPRLQLRLAIVGVFRSWNNPRAIRYRKANGISDDIGTAVTVQAMVFGNRGEQSATGVAFTRDPNTGASGLFGEYLPRAQGEDVVSGSFTPKLLCSGPDSMKATLPAAYEELVRIGAKLEQHHRDIQDLEFTVERGKLWMLQTRPAKRSARASVQIAVAMAEEGLITQEEALRRVSPEELSRLLHASVDAKAHKKIIARGLPASPGAVAGIVCFQPLPGHRSRQ